MLHISFLHMYNRKSYVIYCIKGSTHKGFDRFTLASLHIMVVSSAAKMKSVYLGFFFLYSCQAVTDPCRTYKPYPDVDKRSPENPYQADSPLSDKYLQQGWYGGPGMELAKTPPAMNMCGTQFPLWLKDSTATVAYMCMRKATQDCGLQISIATKSCGNFNVYQLKRTHLVNSGYCVVNKNQAHRPPVYTHKPTVGAGIADQAQTSQLEFNCNFPKTAAEFYTVHWFVNANEIKTFQAVRYSDVKATTKLTESILKENGIAKPGFQLQCGVQAHKQQDGPASDLQKSDEEFIGIKILNSEIKLKEGECMDVMVQLTAPFGCGSQVGNCALSTELFDLQKPKKPCDGTTVTKTTCGTEMFQKTKWNTPVKLQVCGKIGIKYGPHRVTQKLRLRTKALPQHAFWQEYNIGEITVHVSRETAIIKGKRCSAINDPHMTTFSGRRYEHHIDGVFTLFKHLQLPLEVQLETRPCNPRRPVARCNCGLAVRAGETVFTFDRCGRSAWKIGYTQNQQGVNLLDIRQKGHSYRVLLPTGGLVEVQLSGKWLNVYLSPSVKDAEKTGGLCGKLTAQCQQEMTLRNGRVSTDPYANTCNKGSRYYNIFSQNWKAEAGNNLFEDKVQGPWPETELYCSCPQATGTVKIVNKVECSPQKASEECVTMPGFKVFLPQRLVARRRRRSVEDLEISLNFRSKRETGDSNWVNGWTETKAREYCRQMFNSSTSVKLCHSVPNVETQSSEDNCVLDIQAIGTDEFMMSSLDDYRSKCVHEVMMDPEMENKTDPGKPSMMEMVVNAVICPNECNHKGNCTEGVCKCEVNLGGEDCSVNLTKPPMVTKLQPVEGCVLGQCRQASVFGETFVDTAQLKCRLKQLKVLEDGSVEEGPVQEVVTEAVSIAEVRCHLPDIVRLKGSQGTHVNGFRVSVSNTGTVYSRELDMLVLDPRCQKKVNGEQNRLKWETTGTSHCIYNGACVAKGDLKPDGTPCSQRDIVSNSGGKLNLFSQWTLLLGLLYSYFRLFC